MRRNVKILASGALAIALPAAGHTFASSSQPKPQACLAIGATTWAVAAKSTKASVTVRIDPEAIAPDVRIRLADTADEADFVFVDDGTPTGCRTVSAGHAVAIDPSAAGPDVTVGFASGAQSADYRIFIRSGLLTQEEAAALFAAANRPIHTLARTE